MNDYLASSILALASANAGAHGLTNQQLRGLPVLVDNNGLAIAQGKINGWAISNKFGRNPDIDAGTTPEDIWGGSGVYTGFPTGAPETISAVSTSASDTGVLTFTGLQTSSATALTSESLTLNGTTPVVSVNSWYRIHTASYNTGAATTFNIGTITINHSATVANVFLSIAPGLSQSNSSGFTIPAGHTGYIVRFSAALRGGAANSVDGSLWIRGSGRSPRLRRPFTINGTSVNEHIYGGIELGAGTDIIVRATSTAGSNIEMVAGYDIVLVRN